MRIFKLSIRCEDAAFDVPDISYVISKVLAGVAGRVYVYSKEDLSQEKTISDYNGNTIGSFILEED